MLSEVELCLKYIQSQDPQPRFSTWIDFTDENDDVEKIDYEYIVDEEDKRKIHSH